MNVVRNGFLTRLFCLFTGVIFLNMAFFLAEVRMLNIQDIEMVENIANLALNGGLEEERDGHSSGHDGTAKDFSTFYHAVSRHASPYYLMLENIHGVGHDLYLHADHSKKFSPPPDHTAFL